MIKPPCVSMRVAAGTNGVDCVRSVDQGIIERMGRRDRQTSHEGSAAQSRRLRKSVALFASECPMTLFFVLAYLLSWSVFLPVVLFRASPQLTILASFGPSLAALVTNYLATGNYRWFLTSTTWWRTLGGTAIGVALVILAYVVLPAISTAAPDQLNWRILISTGVYNYSTLLGGPLGEEPGWRGYAQVPCTPPTGRAPRSRWRNATARPPMDWGASRCLFVPVGKVNRFGSTC